MKLYTGPANSGKTERILSIVAKSLAERRRVALICPSAVAMGVMHDRLQSFLPPDKSIKPEQSLGTFPSLYNSILINSGMSPIIIHAEERLRILMRVIAQLREEGSLLYFKETADRPGLVRAIAGFIDELSRSNIDAQKFARLADARIKKNRDLALIYNRYADALDSIGAIDAEGAGVAALKVLEAQFSNASNVEAVANRIAFSFPIRLVAVDGFDFYTPLQFGLLDGLDKLGVEVHAALTYREENAVHLWQKRTRERFDHAGVEIIECSAIPSTDVERAADLLLRDASLTTRYDPTHSGLNGLGNSNSSAGIHSHTTSNTEIQIISAPDRAAEVRASAREIKRLVIEEGCSQDQIAIVCRSLSDYAHHLERVFSEFGMELALDCALSLRENPAVKALMRLLSLGSKLFPRRAVMDCLRSPYFDYSIFGLDIDAIDLLDLISLYGNITRGEELWLESIASGKKEQRSGSRTDYDLADLTGEQRAMRLDRLAASLEEFFAAVSVPRAATRKSHSRYTLSLVEELRVRECSETGATSERDLKALDRFGGLLAALTNDRNIGLYNRGDVSGGDYISWQQFYDELEQAVASASYERPETGLQAVVAQEAHHLRPSRYRAVFILGLIEGEFPARIVESAPYASFEREELRRKGIEFAETTTDDGADLLQFYKAMSMARERLYLTCARTDAAGSELLASYLIDEVKSVAKTKEVRIRQSVQEDKEFERNAASLEELSIHTARALRGLIGKPGGINALPSSARKAIDLLSSRLPAWKATLRGARVEYDRLQGAGRGVYDGVFYSPKILMELDERFGPKHLWSASQINDYGVCPFRFFARHALKLARVDEPVEGFASNQLGHAYHRALEKLFTWLNADGVELKIENATEIATLLEKAAEEALEEILSKGDVRRGALWEFEKREFKRQLVRLIQKEVERNDKQPARPVFFERRFGIEGEEPLVIKSDAGDVSLCGIIDRIDESEAGYVVIDYKTGRTPIAHRDALEGRNLQLPIYILAASRVITDGATIASAFYLHINSRKRGSVLPREGKEPLSIEKLTDHAERLILDYVSRARRGSFPVAPNNDKCYQGCEFDVVCRIQSLGARASEEK